MYFVVNKHRFAHFQGNMVDRKQGIDKYGWAILQYYHQYAILSPVRNIITSTQYYHQYAILSPVRNIITSTQYYHQYAILSPVRNIIASTQY